MRNIIIVTTTINEPTIATLKFKEIVKQRNAIGENWKFIIVGDSKTPHDSYQNLCDDENVIYMSPEMQELMYKDMSDLLGWKTIDRRNIGFIHAYKLGADIIATVDDDNIPYDDWGTNIIVNENVSYLSFENKNCDYFDPLSITTHNHLWHRGYPIEHLSDRLYNKSLGVQTTKCLVQADLWNGSPDVDAICRITHNPEVTFNVNYRFGSSQISPFNSQNTFISRNAFPYYACLPFTGRMDDIWGSYIFQYYFPNSVVYGPATVYQERNPHDLTIDLEHEMIGYKNTLKLLKAGENFIDILPEKTREFWKLYQTYFV